MENSTLDMLEQQNKYLRAVMLLLIARYDGDTKIEYVLEEAGLGYQEIAAVLNKKPDAVRMLLKRKRQTTKNI